MEDTKLPSVTYEVVVINGITFQFDTVKTVVPIPEPNTELRKRFDKLLPKVIEWYISSFVYKSTPLFIEDYLDERLPLTQHIFVKNYRKIIASVIRLIKADTLANYDHNITIMFKQRS